MFYAYLVRCADGSYYAGWSNNLEERLAAHNAGRGARYTRSRRPVTLVYHEICPTESAARRREAALKQLTHAAKARLAGEA